MTAIPAHCPSCGAVFASRALTIEGRVGNLELSNNTETCVLCGGTAFLAEGVFNIANDVISILSATDFTKEMFSKLSIAIEEAYNDPNKMEQLNTIAESIDSDLAKVVKKITDKKNSLMMVGLFLLAMTIKSCSMDVSLDVNELIDQLRTQPPQITNIDVFRV